MENKYKLVESKKTVNGKKLFQVVAIKNFGDVKIIKNWMLSIRSQKEFDKLLEIPSGDKNFKIKPFKIIEVCNAKSAYAVLKANIKIGLCLPCKINVYVKDGKTIISGMRPIILPQFFPKAKLGSLPEEVDTIIRGIIERFG